MRRRIAILGSTGSIGVSSLDVVRHLGGKVDVVGLAAGSNTARLAEQARACGCRWVWCASPDGLPALRQGVPRGCLATASPDDLCDLVTADDVDMVLCAIVGTAGLRPVLAAIHAGKDIALASKEVLVMAGEIVMAEAVRRGVRLLPVDSEHCAVFQCLEGRLGNAVRRLILTASGGPFHRRPDLDLASVTVADAMAHPTWKMGGKITIDSATLVNKGLEVIEARWLFSLQPEQIETTIHPQSIIHSMVEFADGSILAQMGYPDMRLPIQYCLTYPERHASPVLPMDFTAACRLEFQPLRHDRFPAIRLAQEALVRGGTCPAAYNAANEVAVSAFTAGRLPFPGIWEVVRETLATHPDHPHADLETVIDDDGLARRRAAAVVEALALRA